MHFGFPSLTYVSSSFWGNQHKSGTLQTWVGAKVSRTRAHSPEAGRVLLHGLVWETAGPRVVQAEGRRGLQAARSLVDGRMAGTQRCRILGVWLHAARGQSRRRSWASLGPALWVTALAGQGLMKRARVAARGQHRGCSLVAVHGQKGGLHTAIDLQASIRTHFCSRGLSGCELLGGEVPITGREGARVGSTGCDAAVAQNHKIAVSIAHGHVPISWR